MAMHEQKEYVKKFMNTLRIGYVQELDNKGKTVSKTMNESNITMNRDVHSFMRIRSSHPAGPHGRLAPKTENRSPIAGGGGFDTINLHSQNLCDNYTTCRLCRLGLFLNALSFCFRSSSMKTSVSCCPLFVMRDYLK